ncbi:MAG: hypothetical protein UY76_C0018G0005 [Candidatus Uhrbacteria bacterium GW2011_GWA2_52_8d]|uniref:Lipoprotein n=1 Tax=Candidatus Uhrbacteria bacterium GW2011_GWA2_52_8d TaxID=1618979 RepID=A0A0G1ZWK2_9BACT|nr:MAG: hypothetical protein UY76_C0018G0005 [Candidatus Uhrbacteria bacterium GW2011_GWA2_52_8d]
MFRVFIFFFFLLGMIGCADVSSNFDTAGEDKDGDFMASEKAITRTYYVSNPTYPYCSSALYLKATGSSITKIVPSGGGVSWDTKTSSGTSSLYDTWYYKASYGRMDKDWSSSSGGLALGTVTVKVTGSSVTKLNYWFTDYNCDHD